jgi:hypothetical protein
MRGNLGFAFLGILIFAATAPAFTAPATYPACTKPDISFQEFLNRFTNDVGFQRSRLMLPLIARAGDGKTSPATVESWSIKQIRDLKDPLIYSTADLRKFYLQQSVDMLHDAAPSIAEVWQRNRAESDAIKLQYWFRKFDGCWVLTELDDWSE